MTVSNTTNFTLRVADAIEEAFERAGVEVRSGYSFRTARRSIDLMLLDWQNRGINLWSVEKATLTLTSGTYIYTLEPDTVDVLEVTYKDNASGPERSLSRYSMSDYAVIPTKQTLGTPVGYYTARADLTDMYLWPAPSRSGSVLTYWRMRRLKDSGAGTNTLDMPARFLPAFVAGLAYYIAQKTRGAEDRLVALKAIYDEDWRNATEEDRERASFVVIPQFT